MQDHWYKRELDNGSSLFYSNRALLHEVYCHLPLFGYAIAELCVDNDHISLRKSRLNAALGVLPLNCSCTTIISFINPLDFSLTSHFVKRRIHTPIHIEKMLSPNINDISLIAFSFKIQAMCISRWIVFLATL